jgi:hypothetical protein
MMANFVFRCPGTGFNVQHQLDDDQDVSENEYEAIACPACTSIHLVALAEGIPEPGNAGPRILLHNDH